MNMLTMNIYASIMIIVVWILRRLFLNKLPKVTFTLLWIVVLIRLFIPFSVSTQLSLYNLFTSQQKDTLSDTTINPLDNFNNLNIDRSRNSPEMRETRQYSICFHWISIVWIIGMGCLLIYFSLSYRKCIQEFRTALPVECSFISNWKKETKTIRPICIRVSDKLSSPLTYGLIKPVILLPKHIDWEDKQNLTYVLEHEWCHIHYFDLVYKAVLIAAVIINWFNPFVWLMYVMANRDIELVCDERVITKLGEKVRKTYAISLLHFEEKKLHTVPLVNHFNQNHTQERIVSIMKFKKISLLSTLVTLSIVGGTATVCATSAKTPIKKVNSSAIVSTKTITNKITSRDKILQEVFPPYTAEEYKEQIDFIKKYADGSDGRENSNQNLLKRMNKQLKQIENGTLTLYKNNGFLTWSDNDIKTSINPIDIMDIEYIKSNYNVKEYQQFISGVKEIMKKADKQMTKTQEEAVLDKMAENLSLLD